MEENLSHEEIVKKLWNYKFAARTSLAKISLDIGYNARHLSKIMSDKNQMSNVAQRKLTWYLLKKEKELRTTL